MADILAIHRQVLHLALAVRWRPRIVEGELAAQRITAPALAETRAPHDRGLTRTWADVNARLQALRFRAHVDAAKRQAEA